MKRLSVLLLVLVVACAAPAPQSLVAPTVANDFFAAFCGRDAHYLATHTGGGLAVTEEFMTAYFANSTKRCTGFRYLGSLSYDGTSQQYVFVVSFGADGELWYVLTIKDGIAVNLE